MTLFNYTEFKRVLGLSMYLSARDQKIEQRECEILIRYIFDEYGVDGINMLKSYGDLLQLFDDNAVKSLLTTPTKLIAIDDEIKEVAWILRLQKIGNSFTCFLPKILI